MKCAPDQGLSIFSNKEKHTDEYFARKHSRTI